VVLEYQALLGKDMTVVEAHKFRGNIRWAVAVAVQAAMVLLQPLLLLELLEMADEVFIIL
jgi:hypothetical protein